ncbi:hypothetical protein BJ170DRAFT_595226 [Xylariales sp. AK1849]|nr:hypothetical protein BJ170DRAFT_595226 [Xylariales sp. AK1849]
MQTTGSTERQFENLDLLQSLIGVKKPPTVKTANGASRFQTITADVMGRPGRSRSPSTTTSERGSVNLEHASPVNVPYQHTPSYPPTGLSPSASFSSIASESQGGSLVLSIATTPGESCSDHLIQQFTSPSPPQSDAGLMALFQKPVPLGFSSERPLPTPSQSSTRWPDPDRQSSLTAMTPPIPVTPTTASFQTQRSQFSVPVSAVELDTQSPFGTRFQQRARPESCSTYPERPHMATWDSNQSGLPYSRNQGLSQFFVYRPRALAGSTTGATGSPMANETALFELEGSIPAYAKATDVQIPRPEVSPANGHLVPRFAGIDAASSQAPATPEVSNTAPPNSEAANRRDRVDSAAWRRKTKLFQILHRD